VRSARENQRLDLQVSEMNEQLQRKVRELTAIINLGKAVISITDQRYMCSKRSWMARRRWQIRTLHGSLSVTRTASRSFLPLSAACPMHGRKKMNMPMDDGVSALVALSGETLAMDGAPLLKFRIANLGRSVCVVPIKVHLEVIGMLVVVRKEERAFTKTEQTLLEAVADYASISLVNSRLFRALNVVDAGLSGKFKRDRIRCFGKYPQFGHG
jgi:two-component system, NtrC family, sensor kinase